MDNELLLFDRLNVIRDTITKYGEENFYISFSGGKDSTVVHHLIDLALPDNKIPRVFCNTGIEYNDIVAFVQQLAKGDDRFVIIRSGENIRNMLEKVGYPFKSKEHSIFVHEWQKGNRDTSSMAKYLTKENFGCPKILRYQFTDDFNLKVSNKCCYELKKKTFNTWMRENKKKTRITGMMKEEGGERTKLDCILLKGNNLIAFHPLAVVSHEWERWYINKYNIQLCRLYYEPYNFQRTGCKGCPFALNLQEQLETMEKYLPNERKQCEIIWKPVYQEYRRLGYRLKNDEQLKLF